jgi:hypothetical protein
MISPKVSKVPKKVQSVQNGPKCPNLSKVFNDHWSASFAEVLHKKTHRHKKERSLFSPALILVYPGTNLQHSLSSRMDVKCVNPNHGNSCPSDDVDESCFQSSKTANKTVCLGSVRRPFDRRNPQRGFTMLKSIEKSAHL